MTMTPTEQRPQECKHYLGVVRCEFEDVLDPEATTTCVFFYGQKHCPDFTPKTKNNES